MPNFLDQNIAGGTHMNQVDSPLPSWRCLTPVFIGALFAVSGCSTLTGDGTSQTIGVETVDVVDTSRIYDAKCTLSNDEGSWSVVTPGSVMIHRSNKLLDIDCRKEGYLQESSHSVDSDTKANMWGNIIFGGGVGAIIDHNNGSAYEYPEVIQVPMRRVAEEDASDAN